MNVQRYADNRTPLAVRCACVDDHHGREQLVTVAKLTWAVSPQGAVTLQIPPRPIRFTAQRAEPDLQSLRFPSDLVQLRPGTDVVLVGTAHPPAGATEMDVVLRVGDASRLRVDKTVKVVGERRWTKGVMGNHPSAPRPLMPTALVYENTFGGRDEEDAAIVEPRNPVGRGVTANPATLVDTLVPCLESPQFPLTSRNPAPACLAPIPSHWMPLAAHAGTHDELWKRTRAPIHPTDFDPRFSGCAPDDQHADPPFRGDEMFEIHGVVPGRIWRFQLPLYRPSFFAKRRDEPEGRALKTHLDTVVVDADEGVVELTWRASIPLPVVPQNLAWVRVGSHDPFPDHVNEQIRDAARAEARP